MTTEIQTKAKELVRSISREDYYVDAFFACMNDHRMTPTGVDEEAYTDVQLINMVHDFWDGLPDSPTIRRGPFFAVCNIAERIFDIDEE